MTTTNTVALINGLNEISHLHQDLMAVAVDFYEEYRQEHAFQSNMLNKLWGQPEFLQQCVLSVREGLILATATISLDSSVPFEEILEGCVNLDTQKFHLSAMNLNPIENNLSINFFNTLRKVVYNQIFEETKNLQSSSELTDEILNSRSELFNKKFT